jgi:hypothetical protein
MERLDMCPPDAAHTGPDGEALLVVPLTIDVAAEFAGALSVMGACAPFGPAAFAAVSMQTARLIASHVNGYAKYPHRAAAADAGVDEARDASDKRAYCGATGTEAASTGKRRRQL